MRRQRYGAAIGAAALLGLTACRPADGAPAVRPWRVAVLQFDDGVDAHDAAQGIDEGLRSGGLQADRDYVLTVYAAQGRAAALLDLGQVAVQNGADALVAIGTPALQAALIAAAGTPVIFTAVADPDLAGLRRRSFAQRWLPFLFADDRPPVTGAYAARSAAELLAASHGVADGALGAVVATGDGDARARRDALVAAAAVESRAVSFESAAAPGDVAAAAAALCDDGARAFVALGDPMTDAAFSALIDAARACRVPVLGTLDAHAVGGAVLTVARDTKGAARQAGLLVARIARGEDPRAIDFIEVAQTRLLLNASAAENADVGIPFSLLQRADEVIDD